MAEVDRLTEIKARVAEGHTHACRTAITMERPCTCGVSDLEYALGVIADQDKQIESLQNKWATRPVTDRLQIERDRLLGEIERLTNVAGTYQKQYYDCANERDRLQKRIEELERERTERR